MEKKTVNLTGNNGRITLSVGSLKINGTSYKEILVSTIDFFIKIDKFNKLLNSF